MRSPPGAAVQSCLQFLSLKKFRVEKSILAIILILILPQIFFLILPNIKLLLPWAFRRFWSGIFVLGILVFSLSWRTSIFSSRVVMFFLIFISIFN